jgi:hypothetical protein
MRLSIQPESILIYYDLPQLFVGVDQIGSKYLALLVDTSDDAAKYLVKPLSIAELSSFVLGKTDLLSILSESSLNAWFYLETRDENSFEPLHEVEPEAIPSSYWPRPGFFLPQIEHVDEFLVEEAYRRGEVVVSISLDSGILDHSTPAYFLGDILRYFQSLVKFAYKKSLNKAKPSLRKHLDQVDNCTLFAFATERGSFRIYLETRSQRDLFGAHAIGRAMERIDSIFGETETEITANLKANSGHAVGSLSRLLESVAKNAKGFNYAWVDPSFRKVSGKFISTAYAADILEIISAREDVKTETVAIDGYLLAADVTTGSWHAVSLDNENFYGSGEGGKLKDKRLFTQRYRLLCEEHIEEEVVSGREKTKLILIGIEDA